MLPQYRITNLRSAQIPKSLPVILRRKLWQTESAIYNKMSLLDQLFQYSYLGEHHHGLLSLWTHTNEVALGKDPINRITGSAKTEELATQIPEQSPLSEQPFLMTVDSLLAGKRQREEQNDPLSEERFLYSKNKHMRLMRFVSIINSKHLKLYYQVFLALEQQKLDMLRRQSKLQKLEKAISCFFVNLQLLQHKTMAATQINCKLKNQFLVIKIFASRRKAALNFHKILGAYSTQMVKTSFAVLLRSERWHIRLEIFTSAVETQIKKMSTVYIKETYRVLKQFSLREHLLGHQRQLNIVKAKTCPLFVLGSCTLSTNMDELPYPPLDKSEKCPKRVAISHVQKLEMQINDIGDNITLFLLPKHKEQDVAHLYRTQHRNSIISWTGSEIKQSQDNLTEISALKMLDFDENAKLEQNSYFADRGLSRYNISSLTVNFPEELDRTQQFAFRESKKYSRADESSKHSHVNEANMNPIVRILGASPSSLVKEFPTGLRILNQNKSKANLQQREKQEEIHGLRQSMVLKESKQEGKAILLKDNNIQMQDLEDIETPCRRVTDKYYFLKPSVAEKKQRKSITISELEADKRVIEKLIKDFKGHERKVKQGDQSLQCEQKLIETMQKIELVDLKSSSNASPSSFRNGTQKNPQSKRKSSKLKWSNSIHKKRLSIDTGNQDRQISKKFQATAAFQKEDRKKHRPETFEKQCEELRYTKIAEKKQILRSYIELAQPLKMSLRNIALTKEDKKLISLKGKCSAATMKPEIRTGQITNWKRLSDANCLRLVISPEAVLSKKIRASKSTKETQKLTVKAHNGAAPARKLTRQMHSRTNNKENHELFRVKCKSIQDADKASKCSQKSDWFKKTTVTKHEELKKGL